MTLPPEKIGDKGQRYVVQATGWPRHDVKGWQNCGYSNTKEGADEMMNTFGQCPGVVHIRILDREPTPAAAPRLEEKTCGMCGGRHRDAGPMCHTCLSYGDES